jgi:integrase
MGETKKAHNRSLKGSVSIGPAKGGLRLRWMYGNKRHELYVAPSLPKFEQTAYTLKTIIEQDLITSDYDDTLQRYKELLKRAALQELVQEQLNINQCSHIAGKLLGNTSQTITQEGLDLIREFDRYVAVKNKRDDTNYYYLTKKFLLKCGVLDIEDIPIRLGEEKWSPKTFNDRRNCLDAFFDYLVQKKKIGSNPLQFVDNKERDRMHLQRLPFSDCEIAAILDALQTNRFVKKSSRYSHSQYYPFVAFLFHVGCRPGEAIGLKVRDVNFDDDKIRIGNSLSRTLKGSNNAARVYKSTKNKKVRSIPMDPFLRNLMEKMCYGKGREEYVFQNENGNTIDDRMFLRRVFRPVLEKLEIDKRDVYACRHTFATRAVRQGMKPHEVAYLMGDNTETILQNYFHNNQMPDRLPLFISETKEMLSVPLHQMSIRNVS